MAAPALLFSTAAFVSALLLFWVQPMIARTLLPVLGGVPAVWNTCMVFFQVMLLAGYGYSHVAATRSGLSRQLWIHGLFFFLAACFLPFASSVNQAPPEAGADPGFWLLGRLLVTVGLPFLFVSCNGPLLQHWISRTPLGRRTDPYSLYRWSNLGSVAGLLSYPALLEPGFRLPTQCQIWAGGYGILGLLLGGCALYVWRSPADPCGPASSPQGDAGTRSDHTVGWHQKAGWMLLAFVPSSLLLGTTTYLTTDIASIPLLWIIPLLIYLLSFVLVFGQRQIIPWRPVVRVLPIVAVGLVFLILSRATQPILLLITVHLAFLFLACLACHGQLADQRPSASRLTEFYLWLALGSALGSACTALVAPRIFTSVAEYPLAIVLACLFRPQPSAPASRTGWHWLDLAFPILLGALAVSLGMITSVFDWSSSYLRSALVIGVPLVLAFTFVDRRVRFGLGLSAVILASGAQTGLFGRILHSERNFFGVSQVTVSGAGQFHHFVHGSTLHGRQRVAPAGECEPLTYYHRTGPVGEIFRWLDTGPERARVAMIGLGAGSTGCYARPGQRWMFYEIDPAVIRIASDTNYFTFLGRCTRAEFEIVTGDARLRMREAPDGYFQLIVLDAFSSDAIPVHLLTREAMQLYRSKLAPGGAIAFHISNRYLDLEPVMGALARDANLVCHTSDDWNLDAEEKAAGKEESQWVIFVGKKEDLRQLNRNSRWLPVDPFPDREVWTDDFSNVLSVFKWR